MLSFSDFFTNTIIVGIPMLVVLDDKGDVITLNGRGAAMLDEEGLVSSNLMFWHMSTKLSCCLAHLEWTKSWGLCNHYFSNFQVLITCPIFDMHLWKDNTCNAAWKIAWERERKKGREIVSTFIQWRFNLDDVTLLGFTMLCSYVWIRKPSELLFFLTQNIK